MAYKKLTYKKNIKRPQQLITMTGQFKIISIEGNIGSGKTTLLANLKSRFSNYEHIVFLKEPVDEWEKIKDENGNTMLKKFYSDQEKYSFAFQMMAYISRLKILRDTVKQFENSNKEIIIFTERSLYTDKHVFAKMLYDQGKIENVCYQIYLNWFEEFAKDYPIDYSIYVETQPVICYERIHKRSREGEELIPLSYLKECHNYHDEFLNNVNFKKLVLNGNIDIFENRDVLEQWINNISQFIELDS